MVFCERPVNRTPVSVAWRCVRLFSGRRCASGVRGGFAASCPGAAVKTPQRLVTDRAAAVSRTGPSAKPTVQRDSSSRWPPSSSAAPRGGHPTRGLPPQQIPPKLNPFRHGSPPAREKINFSAGRNVAGSSRCGSPDAHTDTTVFLIKHTLDNRFKQPSIRSDRSRSVKNLSAKSVPSVAKLNWHPHGGSGLLRRLNRFVRYAQHHLDTFARAATAHVPVDRQDCRRRAAELSRLHAA